MNGPDDTPPDRYTPNVSAESTLIHTVLHNLRAGLRISQFRPVGRNQFVINNHQALAFLGIAGVLALAYTIVAWRGFGFLLYALETGWLTTLGVSCLLLFVMAYCVSVVARDPRGINGFAVIVISAMTLPIAVYIVLSSVALLLFSLVGSMGVPWWLVLSPYLLLILWCFGTLNRALRVTYRLGGMRPALLSLLLFGAFLAPGMYFGWHPALEASSNANAADEADGTPTVD